MEAPTQQLEAGIFTALAGANQCVVRVLNSYDENNALVSTELWLMNRKSQGWNSFGYVAETFDAFEREFAKHGIVIQFHLTAGDEWGTYIPVQFTSSPF